MIEHIKAELAEIARMATAAPLEAGPQDEQKLIARASEGAAARQFLESRLVQEFMARAEANLTRELTALALSDDQGRRNLAVAIQAQRQLWRYLASLAGDGRSAERELERLRKGGRAFF